MIFKVMLSGIAAILWLAHAASAAPKQPDGTVFESLKTQYLSLRNTDLQLRRAAEWRSLAGRFEAFAAAHPRAPQGAAALLDASILRTELYRKRGEGPELQRALDLLARLISGYPQDVLADDALLRQGDLFWHDKNDPQAARRSWQAVIERYPHGDMIESARLRLAAPPAGSDEPMPWGAPSRSAAHGKRAADQSLVLIDPGHGGEDFGAVGPSGLLEKEVTLKIALEIERRLKNAPGVAVELTRRVDEFVPLAERTALANQLDADLFLSLHVNASENSRASGIEIYYLDNSGDAAALKLAARENESLRFEKGAAADLQFMLSDLIQSGKLGDSIVLARTLGATLVANLSGRWGRISLRGVMPAPFYVLVGAHMPCVLVELFFIDHPLDGALLARGEFRLAAAAALADGLAKFLQQQRQGVS